MALRFKAFIKEQDELPEAPIVTVLDGKEAAIEWIKKNASQYVANLKAKKTSEIWRGTYFKGDFAVGDSTKFKRKAAYTSNFVNLLVSTSSEWKGFPPRNQAYICSTDSGDAGQYGETMLVIPADNAVIGVCPEHDFWQSFKELNRYGFDVGMLNNFLDEISPEKLNDKSASELRSQLDHIKADSLQATLDKGELTGYFEEAARMMLAKLKKYPHQSMLDIVEGALHPIPAGFRHLRGHEAEKLGDYREVWITGKVLFINHADPMAWVTLEV